MNPPNRSDRGVAAPGGADDTNNPATSANNLDLQAIREQVEQARAILADAVGKLSTSFTTMDAETRVQREVMQNLLASLEGGGAADGPASAQGEQRRGTLNIREFTVETATFLTSFTDLLASVSEQSIRTVYRIDDMVEQLDEVFTLINSINNIANETFILAVNASIEAARTKDTNHTGHSFAVVAANIRELSKRTRRFNDQIETQVGKARTIVNEVREIISAMATRDLNVALSGKERIESMLTELDGFERFIATSVARASSSTTKISEATNQAVTALQFEDILTQLVSSIRDRAEHLVGAPSGHGRIAPVVRSRFSDPVQQRNMTPGKVDLF